MAQKPGLLGYVTAAFNARPMGMFVAPNWIGLAAAGLLGLANPGFWVIGAGLELGYLLVVATNRRFQNLIDAKQSSGSRGDWDRRIEQTLALLGRPERDRYEALSNRCRSILDIQRRASESVGIGLDAQADSLGRLTWMYLRLLAARQAIAHVLNEDDGDSTDELRERIAELQRQVKSDRADADLARSQEGQIEILRQRVDRRNEAERKRTYIEAELTRIEEQVELIREQAALSTDPEVLSRRIDEIAATLGGTSQWIRDQQQVFGAMEDLLTDPPPARCGPVGREHHTRPRARNPMTTSLDVLPTWATDMRDRFRSGAAAEFILHGNVFDVLPSGGKLLSLPTFLDDVMFGTYDVVLRYDRSRGVRATRGSADWAEWLEHALGSDDNVMTRLREPGTALELIDRYLLRTLNLQALGEKTKTKAPQRIAVIIEFAEFVVPRGDALQLGGPFAANVVKVLGWANDPAIRQSNIVTVLVTEGLHDLNQLVADNPHAATLFVPLPTEAEMRAHVKTLQEGEFPTLATESEVPLDTLGTRLTGLSRVGARTTIALALRNGRKITSAWLSGIKKDLIERECQGLLEFVESPFTLDHVAGLDAVKAWLREDTELLRRGALAALPMGYLIAGRIGTGKTFLVQCWAGELGIPCVVFKNFRDRWVGATESNLEKIFGVLRALGQVVVFVDEADQAAGRRESGDGDSGLSGRVYSMLAKEMSDTRNRGRILWVFATSRPDLLEVDLKRQGRLDVHIPLFPPETAAERRALLLAIARKLKYPLAESDLPPLDDVAALGGHELEGVLVRALRAHELATEPKRALKDVLADVLRDVRPSPHTRKLEYMDLVAVKECTDARFLPARFRDLSPEDLETRIDALRRFV